MLNHSPYNSIKFFIFSKHTFLSIQFLGASFESVYHVELVPGASVDDKPALGFVMKPKAKQAARAIARIQLWADPESGLPIQQEIYHAGGLSQLSVRYISLSREDELPISLFTADWPEGTEIVRH